MGFKMPIFQKLLAARRDLSASSFFLFEKRRSADAPQSFPNLAPETKIPSLP